MALNVVNPNTGAVDYQLHPASAAAVAAAATRARKAAQQWSSLAPASRAVHMLSFRDALLAQAEPLTAALRADTAREEMSKAELYLVAGHITRWAAEAPASLRPTRRPAAKAGYSVRTHYRPYQLVGVLAPWNFPLALALIDSIPALMAGCAVLIKPSEVTPRFIPALCALVQSLTGPLAGGVIELVAGGPDTGAAVVENVDVVCFTGSVRVGRAIAAHCAERMIPVYLELGGKDPIIVDESANLHHAAAAALYGSNFNSGQTCFAVERVYVHSSVHDSFVEILVRMTRECDAKRPLAPLISVAQAQVIEQQLSDAVEKGAVVEIGGEVYVDENGASRVQSTVLTSVTHDMLIMQEETFGPVTPIMMFETRDDAIALANDSQYGLSGAVFAEPTELACEMAERVNVAYCGVNEASPNSVDGNVNKNAFGLSGLGVATRTGDRAIYRYVRTCAQLVKENPAEPSPWWVNKLEASIDRPVVRGAAHGRPFDLMKRYMIGRFDNAAQIKTEKAAGGQKTCFAVHVNTPLDEKIEGRPELTRRTFHVLEETYKWAPGARNATIKPLLLRFEEGENDQIHLTSLKLPDDVDACNVRHDNPFLRFSWEELKQSPMFPISPVYSFDVETKRFSLSVTIKLSASVTFELQEVIGAQRLEVREWLKQDGKLANGCYEDSILYDRKLGESLEKGPTQCCQ